jgi:hypothetical protein
MAAAAQVFKNESKTTSNVIQVERRETWFKNVSSKSAETSSDAKFTQ